MAFPFTIKHTRKLNAKIPKAEIQNCLAYIQTEIKNRKADDTKIEDNKVFYKGSTGGRQSLFAGPDGGEFELVI